MIAFRPTVVDLFAGAGLFSAAFKRENFQIVRAIELDHYAASSYAKNVGDEIEQTDVTKARISGRCNVIVAGPPCQGFSTLGSRQVNDPRNALCLEVAKWASVLKPQVVVIENVPSLLKSSYFNRLESRFEKLGYELQSMTLNAADFGVAQVRRRCFVIASKIGLPSEPKPFAETVDVRAAWKGLPKIPDGKNHHIAITPSPLALARMKVIPPGGGKREIMLRAPELAPKSWTEIGCQATDVWGRMVWDKPSNTLKTGLQNASKGRYIHPDQHRVISLREAARLQTIPDNWTFEGFAGDIARQIGNGVPVALGRAVARQIKKLF